MKKTLTFVGSLIIIGFFANGAVAAINLKSVKNTPKVKSTQQVVATNEPVILVYHSVEPKTDKKEGKMQKHYHVYPENFKAQMQYLKDNGYVPIPMKVYLDHINHGTEIPKKSVVLTFDDGWKNQYEYAYPILKEFGYTATFYIITQARNHPYMSWEEVIELDKAGMDIESHTETHANLAKSDAKRVAQEIIGSKKTLEEKLKHKVFMLAYPYYANNAEVQKVVAGAGYTAARAGWTKLSNTKDTLFALKSQESVNNKNPFSSIADK